MSARKLRFVFVSGLSGAGLSTTLDTLEDLGYETLDNLPLFLLDALRESALSEGRPLAIGLNARTRDFSAEGIDAARGTLREAGHEATLLYLDCSDEVLQRRYTETRRTHPLAADRSVPDAIAIERRLLQPLRDLADLSLDTTDLSAAGLRRWLTGHLDPAGDAYLRLFVTSFAYRRGIPREADLVFDMRFLTNPHYVPHLRPLTGLDPAVQQAVAADPDFAAVFERLEALILPLLPRWEREGKAYLTVAIGCTGGRHRSVFVAEKLAARLREAGRDVAIEHRDIDTESARYRASAA